MSTHDRPTNVPRNITIRLLAGSGIDQTTGDHPARWHVVQDQDDWWVDQLGATWRGAGFRTRAEAWGAARERYGRRCSACGSTDLVRGLRDCGRCGWHEAARGPDGR
jgi:hypothetical protein